MSPSALALLCVCLWCSVGVPLLLQMRLGSRIPDPDDGNWALVADARQGLWEVSCVASSMGVLLAAGALVVPGLVVVHGSGLAGRAQVAWLVAICLLGAARLLALTSTLSRLDARLLPAVRTSLGRDIALPSAATAVAATAVGIGFTFYRLLGPLALLAFTPIGALASYGIQQRLLRWMRVIRPLPPPVERMVRCEAAELGVSVRTLEMAAPVGPQRLNAWALPLFRKVLLSEPLIEAFPPPLLRAIIRHELGHLSQGWRGWLGAANTVAKWELVAFAAWLYTSGHHVWAGLAVCLGTIVVSRVTRHLALSAEASADRAPLRHPAEGRALAEALIELHRQGLVPVLTRWSGPHPPLRERVASLAPDMVGRVPSTVADLAFRRALTLWFSLSTGLPLCAYWLGMLASRMG